MNEWALAGSMNRRDVCGLKMLEYDSKQKEWRTHVEEHDIAVVVNVLAIIVVVEHGFALVRGRGRVEEELRGWGLGLDAEVQRVPFRLFRGRT